MSDTLTTTGWGRSRLSPRRADRSPMSVIWRYQTVRRITGLPPGAALDFVRTTWGAYRSPTQYLAGCVNVQSLCRLHFGQEVPLAVLAGRE